MAYMEVLRVLRLLRRMPDEVRREGVVIDWERACEVLDLSPWELDMLTTP